MNEFINKIYQGDVLAYLGQLPAQSVNCCVTSPPYWGLRDYGIEGQLGLESSPEEYIEKMVAVFREVKRVLADDGTLWVNIGDSYATGGRGFSYAKLQSKNSFKKDMGWRAAPDGLKHKDLVGIPWMLAFALRADGCNDVKACQVLEKVINGLIKSYETYDAIPDKTLVVIEQLKKEYAEAKGNSWYLRQDIIWHKPNPMPESVRDRCTKSHEYIFLLSKSARYYYDAENIKICLQETSIKRLSQNIELQKGSLRVPGKTNGAMKAVYGRKPRPGIDTKGGNQGNGDIPKRGHIRNHDGFNNDWDLRTKAEQQSMGANKRSVWTVATQPFKEAHFATFPEEIPAICIKAGCPEGGLVLDPFMGAATTALVARKLGRNYTGCELNPDYVKLAERRLKRELGLFK